MHISKSIKLVRCFFVIVLSIVVVILGYVVVKSMDGQILNGIELVIGFAIIFIFAVRLMLLKWDEIVYTDDGIQYRKKGKEIKRIKWDDYDTVSFRRGYQGNVAITLMNETNFNKFSMFFSWWFIETEDGRELIDFIENKYNVSI